MRTPITLVADIGYEGPLAPYAGITGVRTNLRASLEEATGLRTLSITPYHRCGEKPTGATSIGSIRSPFGGSDVDVDILCCGSDYLIKPRDTRFFAGARHPYDLSEGELLRDALFFGACVARALPVIAAALGQNDATLLLVLHDWEAATTALALGVDSPHQMVLMVHNVYDGALSEHGLTTTWLQQVGIHPQTCPGPPGNDAATVLQRVLMLQTGVRAVFAVSRQFARDMVDDVYLSRVLAPHLRDLLRRRIRGNDNGLFESLKIPPDALDAARRGDFRLLADWKAEGKSEFVRALIAHESTDAEPIWGDRGAFVASESASPETFWYVSGGRDDSRMRGHDVLAAAIPGCLDRWPQARFLFLVMPGDEDRAGMGFLRRIADKHPGKVLVLPFRFRSGYRFAMRGAAWSVMPSFFGPFESAHEAYLIGATAVIGRCTGGLIQQIIPLRACASFGLAVESRVDGWYPTSACATGILYRERDDPVRAVADWRSINSADYSLDASPDRLEVRNRIPLFRAMAHELGLALDDAARTMREPALYHRMVVEGVDYLRRTFSWRKNANEIARLISD